MKKEKPFVSICIPLYAKDKWFDKLIKSIEEHDAGIDYEICYHEEKQCTSYNRNRAQRKAKSNYICQLDGDAEIIQNGWLGKMYSTLINEKNVAIVGCIVEKPDGKVDHCGAVIRTNLDYVNKRIDLLMRERPIYEQKFIKGRLNGSMMGIIDYEKTKDKLDNQIYKVAQCSGVCFLYDKRKMGEFLELMYKKAGWEDVDFFARALFCGYNIVVDGRVRVKHPNHERNEREHLKRDAIDSPRGFNPSNLYNFILRWGTL